MGKTYWAPPLALDYAMCGDCDKFRPAYYLSVGGRASKGSPLRRSLEGLSPVSQQNPLVEVPDFGREARRVRVVRDHDDGFVVIAVEFFEQRQRLLRRSRVQVAGRLVGQNKIGVGDDSAGDGDALLLTAGELARQMAQAVTQPDQVQRRRRVLHTLALLQIGQLQRQFDVLESGHHRDQVEGLKDESDMLISPMRHLAVAQAAQVLPEHENLAVGGAVHRGDQVQQRGFARAGRPHQRDELAAMNCKVDFFQRDDMKIIADEFLGKLLGFDHCFGHNFCSSLKKMPRYSTARVSKRLSYKPAACLRARYCTGLLYLRFRAHFLPVFQIGRRIDYQILAADQPV